MVKAFALLGIGMMPMVLLAQPPKDGPVLEEAAKQDTIIASSTKARPQFWYEDNNVRRAGGYPPDFQQMWEEPESWKELRSILDVYYIRGNTLKNVTEDLGKDWIADHLGAVLIESGLPVAIDNPGRGGAHLDAVKFLQDQGVEIQSIALQSVLSKFAASGMTPNQQAAEIRRRIPIAVEQLKIVRQAFPKVALGIIDALPAKGLPWRRFYPEFVHAARDAGVEIAFIHVDCPLSRIGTVVKDADLRDLRRVISNELRLDYGFICTDNVGGMESDAAYHASLQHLASIFPRGVYPDAFIVMSWYYHPRFAVRRVEGSVSMTQAALEFFLALD